MSSEVFLLGAGFSKAISPSMPLMAELGKSSADRLGNERPYLPPGLDPNDFEAWLSYLAEDQPWLLPEDLYRNKSGYLRVSRTIASEIADRESEARRVPMPDWLRSLVAYWHETQATVITFNYDLLVEAAYLETVRVTSKGQKQNYVSAQQIATAPMMPLGSRYGAVLSASRVDTFKLVKLHGSRSWLYSGRDSYYGEVIYDLGAFGAWSDYGVPDWLAPLAVDKVPLVVPPTAGKSGFFNNETVRSQWSEAYRRLRDAIHVYIVGYSFPVTDTMIRYLFQETHWDGRGITVVNRSRSTYEKLSTVLPPSSIAEPIEGNDAVSQLASRLQPQTTTPESLARDY